MSAQSQLKQRDVPPPAYTDSDAELLFGTPPPPPTDANKQHLHVPVCLPQITGGYDSPFARGYNPQLAVSGIEENDWLRFLDSLNIAMVSDPDLIHHLKAKIEHIFQTASPPLRVVDVAGMIIGFVLVALPSNAAWSHLTLYL